MSETPRKEIYTFKAPWTVFSLAWSHRQDSQFRLAIGSYVEQYSNAVQVVKKHPHENTLYKACEFDHPYPCTKILWSPDRSMNSPDLLATTGDYLRIWKVTDDGSGRGTLHPHKEALLNNVRTYKSTYYRYSSCRMEHSSALTTTVIYISTLHYFSLLRSCFILEQDK